MSGYHQKGSLASQVTGATGGKTRAAIRAARNEAYKRRDADRAANMRKRPLPDDVGSVDIVVAELVAKDTEELTALREAWGGLPAGPAEVAAREAYF